VSHGTGDRGRAVVGALRRVRDALAAGSEAELAEAIAAHRTRLDALMADGAATGGGPWLDDLARLEAEVLPLAQRALDATRDELTALRRARGRVAQPAHGEAAPRFVSRRA